MSNLDENLESLLGFLDQRGQSSAANDFRKTLLDAGLGARFRGKTAVAPAQKDSTIRRQREILIGLAKVALERAISEFEPLRSLMEARLAFARRMRLTSALITTVLSSGVVASLSISKESFWGIILGILALISSLLTVVAARLDGGSAGLTERYAEAVGKEAEARAAVERLAAYEKEPMLFNDVDTLIAEAAALTAYLNKAQVQLRQI